MQHHAPWWLPGGHAQTIWPALCARHHTGPRPTYRRELWITPDGDHIAVDDLVLARPVTAPLLVLFHGLEGSSHSHYALALADWCRTQGWGMVVPHFRGCGGIDNLAPRAYHSGDYAEIDWVLRRLRTQQPSHQPIVAVGVSLGGNALMRWAGELGQAAAPLVSAIAALSAPLDLSRCGQAMGHGINRWIYTRSFLATMKPKALRKLAQFPGLFDRQALLACRTLYEFDNVFTAPLHGFRDTDDYWQRAAALPVLKAIEIPALLLNARNDPFVPASGLPRPTQVSAHVTLWQPADGGHVGFAQGHWPGEVWSVAATVGAWLHAQLPRDNPTHHG